MEVTDSTDIETLFKKNYNSLCLSATHYVNDIDVAEDIVMDCFVKYYERSKDSVILNPLKYLYQMTRFASIDYLRAKGNTTINIDNLEICDSDFYSTKEQSDREARLWKAIDSLSPVCRNVFLLSKRDGLKNKDIADELNISVKTVEAHITKAYSKLKGTAKKIYAILFL